MYKSLTITTTILLVLAMALPSPASPVNDGDRNFQRAWRVYVTRNNEQALEYFKASAQAYGEALQQDPVDRTMKFQSSMDKGGHRHVLRRAIRPEHQDPDRGPGRKGQDLGRRPVHRPVPGAQGRQGGDAQCL